MIKSDAYAQSVIRPQSGKLVMIIDDDEDFSDLIAHTLTYLGYEAIKMSNSRDALRKLQSMNKLPDLILLDYQMPKENGFRFWMEFNEHLDFCHIPTILVSAHPPAEDILGIRAYIQKPVDLDHLSEAVKKVLEPSQGEDYGNA